MSKRLKIFFLTSWFPTTDRPHFGIFIRDWAKAAKIYDDVVVLHLFGQDKQLKKPYSIEKETNKVLTEGLNVFRVRYRKVIFPLNIFQYFVYAYAVLSAYRKIAQVFNPNIVHAHILRAGLFACIIKKLYHKEFLLTECYTNVQTQELTLGEILRLKIIGKFCPLILAISKALKRAILSFKIKSRVKIVPCTVDTKKYEYYPKEKKQSYKILTLSNLIPRKGIDVFLKAVSLINRKDFKVLIGGEGPQKKQLFKLVKQLNIEDKVNFLGFVNENKKIELFQSCDVFVLPSHKENFGVVLIEAMACGKPVIATRCGGPEDFIIPEVGILVPPGNSKIMRDALETMLDKIQIYDSLKIFQYAKEKFSYETVGEKLHNIYMSLIL